MKEVKRYLTVTRDGGTSLGVRQPKASRGELVFPMRIRIPDQVDMPEIVLDLPPMTPAEVTLDALDVIVGMGDEN